MKNITTKKRICCLYLIGTITGVVSSSQALAGIDITDNSTLDSQGYLRTGIETTEGGDSGVTFGAPGAISKYRLGNEGDTVARASIDYRLFESNDKSLNDKNKSIQAYVMIQGFTAHNSGEKISFDNLDQAYISMDNYLADGVNVWVGRRYYERMDTYITDHYWLNTVENSQASFGIEGIKIGSADLNMVLISAEDNIASESINSTAFDMRLKNIITNEGGNLNLWAYYNVRQENDTAGLDSENGYGLGAWHIQSLFGGKGKNTTHILYRDGTAVSQNSFTPNPLMNNGTTQDIKYIEVATDLVTNINADWDIGFTALYRDTEETTIAAGTTSTKWYSIGVRPQYAINDNLSWVFDLGHDHVNNGTTSAGVTKTSLALQLGVGRGYWSRPVIRIFTTYAKWGNEFKGQVGGASFADSTDGVTYGAQAEWWY